MTEEQQPEAKASSDAILQAKYLRSLSSFEGIVLAQIEMKNQLSNRLNWTIRAGLILLGVIAFSILVLLLTLSSQINRISGVVVGINDHFDSITERMDRVSLAMASMEIQVALLQPIEASTSEMDREMQLITGAVGGMQSNLDGIRQQLSFVRGEVGNISVSVANMNAEMGAMASEIHYMAKPARNINRIFPIPR